MHNCAPKMWLLLTLNVLDKPACVLYAAIVRLRLI